MITQPLVQIKDTNICSEKSSENSVVWSLFLCARNVDIEVLAIQIKSVQ